MGMPKPEKWKMRGREECLEPLLRPLPCKENEALDTTLPLSPQPKRIRTPIATPMPKSNSTHMGGKANGPIPAHCHLKATRSPPRV